MGRVAMDEVFDFVVVGSGGGSMCAGLFMRSVGKSVLVLEKTDLIGGSTARSGGVMWIPTTASWPRTASTTASRRPGPISRPPPASRRTLRGPAPNAGAPT